MKTRVTFLLDRSQSMQAIKPQTISGFNEYVGRLQNGEAANDMKFDFIQFDDISTDVVIKNRNIKAVEPLTFAAFVPRGNTPLIDATMRTIYAIDEARREQSTSKPTGYIDLTERGEPGRQVLVILTDGQENASRTYNKEGLRREIERRQADGWEVVFLGVGFDAYAQAADIGIRRSSTMSLSGSDASIQRSYANLASNTSLYAMGAAATMDWSDHQRADAEDPFAGLAKGNPVGGLATGGSTDSTPPDTGGIDLGGGSSGE